MNILSVSSCPPDGSAQWIRIDKIMHILESNGHSVDIIFHSNKKINYDAEYDSLGNSKIKSLVKRKQKIIQRSDEYDLIIGNNHLATTYSLCEKIRSVPILYDLHGGLLEEHGLHRGQPLTGRERIKYIIGYSIKKAAFEANIRVSDRLNCVSQTHKNKLTNEGIPEKKLNWVTNGVNINKFNDKKAQGKKIRDELEIGGSIVFGYIGNFQPWQGTDKIINMAEKRDDSTKFLIVGEERENKKDIKFIEPVDRSKVIDYYDACDILILPRPDIPATRIAFPTKFGEYVAMSKPVLATDVGDAAKFIEEYNCGVVIDDNSERSLSDGIDKFKSMSNSKLQKLGDNSRKLAEAKLSLSVMEKQLVESVRLAI